MEQEGKLIIKNENGEEKEFSILVTFDLKERNKSFVLYTDYSKTEQGDIKIYSSTYDNQGNLQVVSDEEEQKIIEEYIETLEKDLKSGFKLY